MSGIHHHTLLLRPPAADNSQPSASMQSLVDLLDRIRGNANKQASFESLIAAPWLTMPPDGESFHYNSGIIVPGQDALFHAIVSFTVPNGRNGVLNRFANPFYGTFTNFSGDLIWQITRNQSSNTVTQMAERNYEKITAVLGLAENPVRIAPIRVFENDLVQIVAKNVGITVGGQVLGGILGGWFYPRTWDDQFERMQQDFKSSW